VKTAQPSVPLVLVSDLTREGSSARRLVRGVQAGEQRRIRRGVYAPASAWDLASDRERHVARMRAVERTSRAHPIVFSHRSAALMWGIPVLGRWPANVHALAMNRRGVRSGNGVVWHRESVGDDEVYELNGFLVTNYLRTLADLARSTEFASAVVSLDHGTKERVVLPDGTMIDGVSREILLERLNRDGPARGVRSARAALEFCNPLSGSPGESYSRVQMHRLRFPPPRLQVAVPRRDGYGKDIPDFDWKEALGEFDGKVKYTRDQYTGGRAIEEIVWDEKRREDRLRRTTKKDMARWLWEDAMDPVRLRDILLDAGLTPLAEAQYRRECVAVPR